VLIRAYALVAADPGDLHLMTPDISLIVAALNEEQTIERCVQRLFAVFPSRAEVLVVDGGSDGTQQRVEQMARTHPGLRYVRNEHDRGKGHAIRVGVAAARGRLQAQIDADLQFLPEELPQLLAPLETGRADVVLGSRFAHGATRRQGGTPLLRSAGNHVASAYASVLFRHPMTDIMAGMKAWTREAMARIHLRSDNYSYEVEIPARALMAGLRVVDVPVTTQARQGGETHVNVVRDGLRLLWDITRFRAGG